MKEISTSIPDVKILEPSVYTDSRGFFMEAWNRESFRELGIDIDFVQDNHSRSDRGVLRGLHYQIKSPQGKLVRVVSGAVYDVAVDLRRSSPTFGRWVSIELSSDNLRMAWIPPCFAHGFMALQDGTDFLYKCTDYYAPELERTLSWDDPDLAIEWPGSIEPRLSSKDEAGLPFKASETFP